MVSGGAGQIEIAAFGGSTIPNSSFLTPNSFKPVRFQKECGKISLLQSVLSKGNTDFFLEECAMTILETKDLRKVYGSGDTEVRALDGVDLTVEKGEFVAVVGTSGSGKSTLLHMLGGLDRPTSGAVLVDGKDIFSLKDEELTIFRRRKIGFVFQSYNLVPVLSVYENIVLPIQLDGGKVDQSYVNQVIEALGLEQKLQNLPSQLSGGQQQRVAIARALVNNPQVIVADEPTGNLDPQRSLEIMMLLEKINELGTTVLVVTHEKELVNRFSKRVVAIENGRIISDETGGYYNNETTI